MENSQAVQYLTENRKKLLSYIRSKGLTHSDAEDLLTEATADVLTYYKEERTKSVHLAIGRQLDKYYKGYGTVAQRHEPSELVPYKEGDWIDDLNDSSKELSLNPADILLLREERDLYPEKITKFTSNPKLQHLLEMVFVDHFDVSVAQDVAGVGRSHASRTCNDFVRFAEKVEG